VTNQHLPFAVVFFALPDHLLHPIYANQRVIAK
jgi:hypothetical protein